MADDSRPICVGCQRLHVTSGKTGTDAAYTCSAFPNGIPHDILSNRVIHTKVVSGDHGLQFVPRSGWRVSTRGAVTAPNGQTWQPTPTAAMAAAQGTAAGGTAMAQRGSSADDADDATPDGGSTLADRMQWHDGDVVWDDDEDDDNGGSSSSDSSMSSSADDDDDDDDDSSSSSSSDDDDDDDDVLGEPHGNLTELSQVSLPGGTVQFRTFTKAQRDKLAANGHALPDGSYPIENKSDLDSAIILCQSGHGDVAAATKLIKKRAHDLNAEDSLPASFGKDAKAEAGYVAHSTTNNHCSGCVNFISGASGAGACKSVEGAINADGWCSHYSAKGGNASHSVGVTRDFAQEVHTDPSVVSFASKHVENGMVVRQGLIFKAGDYPDKGFSLTPFELANAVATFKPVHIDSGHPDSPSPLDGLMGRVRRVTASRDFENMYGEVELPVWLDKVLGDKPVPVSAVWGRADKTMRALSLVRDPRVADAALVAAFADAAVNTPHGLNNLQQIHDMSSGNGAVCSKPAKMAARHELDANQQIHDITVTHGAKCKTKSRSTFGANPGGSGSGSSVFSRARSTGMGVRDRVLDWFAKGQPEEYDPFESSEDTSALTGTQTGGAEFGLLPSRRSDTAAEVDVLKRQLMEERAHRIHSDAVSFADGEIHAERATPAEREDLIDEFVQCAADDQTYGAAKFSDGSTKSRIDILRSRHARRPARGLTREMLLENGLSPELLKNLQTTAQFGQPKAMDASEKDRLLGLTALGQKVRSNK